MRILIDSDVCIDFLTGRTPYFTDAKKLFWEAENNRLHAVVSPESFSNMFYVLRKFYPAQNIFEKLRALRSLVDVINLTGNVIDQALDSGWNDFEDSIQFFCAKENRCEMIVTRNIKDFNKSTLPVLTPFEFLTEF